MVKSRDSCTTCRKSWGGQRKRHCLISYDKIEFHWFHRKQFERLDTAGLGGNAVSQPFERFLSHLHYHWLIIHEEYRLGPLYHLTATKPSSLTTRCPSGPRTNSRNLFFNSEKSSPIKRKSSLDRGYFLLLIVVGPG